MAKSIVNDLLFIFKSSVSAVLPETLMRTIKYNPASQNMTVDDQQLSLLDKNVYLVGAGKAVQNMSRELEKILGNKIKNGIVSIPEGSILNSTGSRVIYSEGALNNLPDIKSQNTTRKIKDLVTQLGNDDFLLVVISGGGSALLSLPKETLTLEDKIKLIKSLANVGADIKELNTVRKKLSVVKGGQLAIDAQPAQVISLILSDIVGDPIDLIASGPTVKNEDNPTEALNIIKKYKLFDDLPESIKHILKDNVKPTSFPNENIQHFILGSNKFSLKAAKNAANELGYYPQVLSTIVTGDVKQVAKRYATLTQYYCNLLTQEFKGNVPEKNDLVKSIKTMFPEGNYETDAIRGEAVCLILGGEPTIEVKGSGKGGRNQQLALEYSICINEIRNLLINFEIYMLSAGTDGIDGPTDVAGAIGYLDLVPDAAKDNIDLSKYLENNDSYHFYKLFKNGELHVITGHTHTNVMDIHLIIIKNKFKSLL